MTRVYDEKNTLIMTPGPVDFHPRVYEAMSRVEYHHRTPEYRLIFGECVSMLKEIMQTKKDVFIISGSGTSAMDAAIANCVAPGDEVLNLVNGKFSERWMAITKTYGGKSISLQVEWGKAIKPAMVAETLESNPRIKFVTMVHNETSTAVLNPAFEIAQVVKKHNKILIVDGITSVGGDYVYADAWNFDILVSGSQKCLGCPPGLGIIMVGPRAWSMINKRKMIPSYYLNLKSYQNAFAQNSDTPTTSAIPLIYALHESLSMILEEGIENRVRRHRMMAEATRKGVSALNLQLLAEKGYESNTLTAVKYPSGIEDKAFRGSLRSHGLLVAGGQSHLKGKIFRLAHMNIVGEREILLCLALLELVLKEQKFACKNGVGVSAAEEVFLNLMK